MPQNKKGFEREARERERERERGREREKERENLSAFMLCIFPSDSAAPLT